MNSIKQSSSQQSSELDSDKNICLKPEKPEKYMNLAKFCYLYTHPNYKYSVVCIESKYFIKKKLKRNPNVYDTVYAHIVKTLQNALSISNEKYHCNEFIVFLDMKHSTMKQLDTTFAKTLIVILQSTFTDNLKYCIVKNAPKLFKIIYRIIYPFIDKVTRKKFVFEKKGALTLVE
tara:strand:- start:2000 stop:2524 length:525 start_codon:yes stop_codon:yes gene_type:complete